MPDNFGARMRERREQQHVALSTIADQTKIKLSLLQALERDDVSQWPSGIFRRAFIRAYAKAIGLEPDVVVREFVELYPDPGEVVAVSEDGQNGGRLRDFVASAIGSVSRLRGRGAAGSYPSLDFNGPTESATVQPMPPATHSPSREDLPDIIEPVVMTEPAAGPPQDPAGEPQTEPSSPIEVIAQTRESQPEKADDPAVCESDLLAMANLCTELGRVETTGDVAALLEQASMILDAIGLIVWVWDPIANELRPALAHGYSDQVLAQLPRVDRDGNNATAAAFREAETCIVHGTDHVSGALAVPILTPVGCGGVLAMELNRRREEHPAVRALATILAAQVAGLVGSAHPAKASDRRLA
jgi:transcriptional regulator with XRE-family HTH domain